MNCCSAGRLAVKASRRQATVSGNAASRSKIRIGNRREHITVCRNGGREDRTTRGTGVRYNGTALGACAAPLLPRSRRRRHTGCAVVPPRAPVRIKYARRQRTLMLECARSVTTAPRWRREPYVTSPARDSHADMSRSGSNAIIGATHGHAGALAEYDAWGAGEENAVAGARRGKHARKCRAPHS